MSTATLVVLTYTLIGQPLTFTQAYELGDDPRVQQHEVVVDEMHTGECVGAMHRLWAQGVDAACLPYGM